MTFNQGRALLIGIGSYANAPHLNVPITVSDARAVDEVLRQRDLCGYPANQVSLLLGQSATRASILSALETLAGQARPEDTVVLFYSGHGDYGTDGNYYLTAHDTGITDGKILKGTGISEADLLDKLRQIPARRVLLLLNACHAGELSPTLGLGSPSKPFGSLSLSHSVSDALLSSGEGRIIITACRPEQNAWIGTGLLTPFTQALVDGLNGKGYVTNNHGYISVFNLYEHIYQSVKALLAKWGLLQEPELTVLKGVGPFPVALYHGASELGLFETEAPPAEDSAVRTIEPERSQRFFQQIIKNVIASGERSVAIGGSVNDSTIITGNRYQGPEE